MGLLEADTGKLVARWDYDPFGNLVTDWYAPGSSASAASCPMRFSSKYHDEETGWLYYGYRYYEPVNGRFIGRDPIEEAGGVNLYAFCGNDGVNRWDLLGMAWGVGRLAPLDWLPTVSVIAVNRGWYQLAALFAKWFGLATHNTLCRTAE